MHYNCLIVDDEIELAKMTAEYFEMFDIKTRFVGSALDCYNFLDDNEVDIILLDINLGDGSGFDVCKRVREDYQLPILFISARQSDDDVLVALSIGGDDYIKKPYSLSVLLAKVKVNLKRVDQMKKLSVKEQSVEIATSDRSNNMATSGWSDNMATSGRSDNMATSGWSDNMATSGRSDNMATSGRSDNMNTMPADADSSLKSEYNRQADEKIALDTPTMSAVLNGKRIPLKAKEFALLKALYEHKNTIVTKDRLFDEVWGDTFYSDGTLNVHIRKLREKLEKDPNNPEFIKTIWGTGYMLEI